MSLISGIQLGLGLKLLQTGVEWVGREAALGCSCVFVMLALTRMAEAGGAAERLFAGSGGAAAEDESLACGRERQTGRPRRSSTEDEAGGGSCARQCRVESEGDEVSRSTHDASERVVGVFPMVEYEQDHTHEGEGTSSAGQGRAEGGWRGRETSRPLPPRRNTVSRRGESGRRAGGGRGFLRGSQREATRAGDKRNPRSLLLRRGATALTNVLKRTPTALLVFLFGIFLAAQRPLPETTTMSSSSGRAETVPDKTSTAEDSDTPFGPSPAVFRLLPLSKLYHEGLLDGGFFLGFAQTPLTCLNSVLSVSALSARLFGEKRKAGTRTVAVSVGFMNVVGAFTGTMPCCHGAGGLAAQHKFGARSNRAVVFLGSLKLFFSLVFGRSALDLLRRFPDAILGAMLIFVGVELADSGLRMFFCASATKEEGSSDGNVASPPSPTKDLSSLLVTAGVQLKTDTGKGFLAGLCWCLVVHAVDRAATDGCGGLVKALLRSCSSCRGLAEEVRKDEMGSEGSGTEMPCGVDAGDGVGHDVICSEAVVSKVVSRENLKSFLSTMRWFFLASRMRTRVKWHDLAARIQVSIETRPENLHQCD